MFFAQTFWPRDVECEWWQLLKSGAKLTEMTGNKLAEHSYFIRLGSSFSTRRKCRG